MVGAHYDAFGELPGADDNKRVAGLIELSHLLAQSVPSVQVELVAQTLEELLHFGTQIHRQRGPRKFPETQRHPGPADDLLGNDRLFQ